MCIVHFGQTELWLGTAKFLSVGNRFSSGCKICCAVGIGSRAGAPMPGSVPRFSKGSVLGFVPVFGVTAGSEDGCGVDEVGIENGAPAEPPLGAGCGAT